MRGILKAGPAIDPLRLMYMTASCISARSMEQIQTGIAAYLGRRL